MSELCHDWELDGYGCVVPMHDNGGECPIHCLGDFTYDARRKMEELEPDEEITLGMCEGHGAVFVLGRTEKGFYVRHGAIEGWDDRADVDDELLGDTPWVPVDVFTPEDTSI